MGTMKKQKLREGKWPEGTQKVSGQGRACTGRSDHGMLPSSTAAWPNDMLPGIGH